MASLLAIQTNKPGPLDDLIQGWGWFGTGLRLSLHVHINGSLHSTDLTLLGPLQDGVQG
jgi:hypothetical protein